MPTKTPKSADWWPDRQRNAIQAGTQADLEWQDVLVSDRSFNKPQAHPGSAAWVQQMQQVQEHQTLVDTSTIPAMTEKQRAVQLEAQLSRRQQQQLDSVRQLDAKRAADKAYRQKQKKLELERKFHAPRIVLGGASAVTATTPVAQSERMRTASAHPTEVQAPPASNRELGFLPTDIANSHRVYGLP